MKKHSLLCTLMLPALMGCQTSNPGVVVTDAHFRVYTGDGSPVSLEQVLASSRQVEVTFVGEDHDDPVAHHLESVILEGTWEPALALSLEMFESDVQYVVDEYLADLISEEHLLSSGRRWQNYEQDYRPLVEFSKAKGSPVIAANAPRRYVNRVSRLGAESLQELDEVSTRYLPPLPYAEASPAYVRKFSALMGQSSNMQPVNAGATESASHSPHSPEASHMTRMLEAQSLWDASMAWSIASHLGSNPGTRLLHVNGSFHSAERMGILDHLERYRPGTTALVVTIIPSADFPDFDIGTMAGQGDFVIASDGKLARSY